MRYDPFERPILASRAACRLLACALVLIAGGLFSASAEASCGDYLVVGGHHPSHSTPAVNDDSPPLPDRPACSGPSCHNRSIPPLAPTSRLVLVVEHWAFLSASPASSSGAPRLLPATQTGARSLRVGSSLFRPPRRFDSPASRCA